MANIYELTGAAVSLYELLQSGEIDEQTFSDTLEAMGAEEKLEAYAKLIKQFKADAEMYKSEKDRLAERQHLAENSANRLAKSAGAFLKAGGQKKMKAGIFELVLTKGERCEVVNEDLLDERYWKPGNPVIDKAAIRAELLAGNEVPGAVLVLSEGVKVK